MNIKNFKSFLKRKKYKKSLESSLNSEGELKIWAELNIISGDNKASNSRAIFQKAKDLYPETALTYGFFATEEYFDPSYNSEYANRLKATGDYDKSALMLTELEGLELVKPNITIVDSVFGVLSKRFDSINAEKWFKFLISSSPEHKSVASRKFFIAFKDIDANLACSVGKFYVEDNPDDLKFSKVFLKRSKLCFEHREFIELCEMLSQLNSSNVYAYPVMQNEISESIADVGEGDAGVDIVEALIGSDKEDLNPIMKMVFDSCHDKNSKLKAYAANKLTDYEQDCRWKRKLCDHYLSLGNISKSKLIIDSGQSSELIERKRASVGSFKGLFEDGYIGGRNLKSTNLFTAKSKTVFYLLHNRLPYNSGGYATRSHGLLTSIDKQWDVQGVSRLGFPQDRAGFDSEPFVSHHDIDGIRYHCLKADGNAFGEIPISNYLDEYTKELQIKCEVERPAIIHAASNYMNGLVATTVAKNMGIKSVYEVRGLWEITRISKDPAWEGSEYFQMMVNLEAQAAKNADAVFTLTSALREELVLRGVERSKITLLPNGVDSSRFVPKTRDEALAGRLGLSGKTVIGFLGSVVQYEGVEYIVEAAEKLRERGYKNFAVLIVGDGAVLDNVKSRVDDLALNDLVVFTGRVPHDEIEDYYSIVDICPLPRKGLPVCEMVSPLKPFEAMAMGKAVVSSDVAALAEIIQDGVTGLLHKKDDVDDLADKLAQLIDDPELNRSIGLSAREWVLAERDWKVIAKRVDKVYQRLLA